MTFFECGNDGGFFYIVNPNLILTKNGGTNWNHLFANKHGGLVEGAVSVDSSFSVPCRLGNITENFPAAHPPDFAGGAVDVKGCTITCGTGIITPD